VWQRQVLRTEKWPPVITGSLAIWLLANPNLTLFVLGIESVNEGPADIEDFTNVTFAKLVSFKKPNHLRNSIRT
jgi:hypothetical protein